MKDFRFLKVIGSPTREILDILNNNIIGTPGQGMLYQHLGVQHKISRIQQPYYVNLMKKDRVIGTCCFCRRTTVNAGREIRSFYIRYFSFRDGYRSRQISKKQLVRHSILRSEISAVLAGRSLETGCEKFFHYAYVDPRNVRSARLCSEFGFESVREYATVIFSRIGPKEDQRKQVVEPSPAEQQEVKALLGSFYETFNMFSFDNLFNGSNYFVMKDAQGRIAAGAQANPDRWSIRALPGLSGKIILKVFSHVPYLNKLMNKDYRFLTIEGIYHAPGCEHYLETLLETLLARYQLNAAMMVVDAATPLYSTLKSLKLGLVNKLNKEVRGNVICKFVNFSGEEAQMFRTRPAYISGMDVT